MSIEGAASCKPVMNRDLAMPSELIVRDLNTKLSAVNAGDETLRFTAQLIWAFPAPLSLMPFGLSTGLTKTPSPFSAAWRYYFYYS